jgi:quinol-cytochrome oxidoreductase complex cytochrome b subunit
MIKKIMLLLAIVGPFGLYFLYSWLLKLEVKKIPIKKLTISSIILLIIALGVLRFYGDFNPNTKYSPAKYEDGELKPAENK